LTWVLGLSEADLLAQLTQKGRYTIKVAEKQGVVVKEDDLKGLHAFYEVFRETAGRDGFYLHQEAFYRDFLALLGKDAALYTVWIGDELVGGLIATFFDHQSVYYFGASSGKHRETMAPYALQWHAIRAAKRRGLKIYDFFGVAPEGEPKHVLSGVTQFKTRFGGKRVDYAEPRVFVYQRMWWLLSRLAKFMRKLYK
jgi:lipid II:glycine glycyltransferase (peptidoglycan interpeptide bridge formation enzyme)